MESSGYEYYEAWLTQLEQAQSTAFLGETLDRALQVPEGQEVSAEDAKLALVAAEAVAAILGKSGVLPDEVKRWVKGHKQIDEATVVKAQNAVKRITENSDYLNPFVGGKYYRRMKLGLDGLLKRLSQ